MFLALFRDTQKLKSLLMGFMLSFAWFSLCVIANTASELLITKYWVLWNNHTVGHSPCDGVTFLQVLLCFRACTHQDVLVEGVLECLNLLCQRPVSAFQHHLSWSCLVINFKRSLDVLLVVPVSPPPQSTCVNTSW